LPEVGKDELSEPLVGLNVAGGDVVGAGGLEHLKPMQWPLQH